MTHKNHENTVKLLATQAAAMFGMSLTTYYLLRRIHADFPRPCHLIGRRHAWDAAEVIEWFNTHPTRYRQQFDPFDAAELAQHTDAPTANGAASHA